MRGTGCSGGAFDLLGYPSDYDGYDIVQAVGAQPWVLHHKVGLVGISYSGLSQFPVAGTDPPDLAAIAPLSPTDDLFSTGYPGGIYNDGFAKSWIAQRISDAEAAPGGGQTWAKAEIATGDKTCLANQRLHPEAEGLASLVGPGLARVPSLFNRRSPAVWATHINVPVFLVGSLEDEEVGPQWPALITALKGDKNVYVTMDNGTHTDSLGPDTISRWLEFLDIYVAGRCRRPADPGPAGLRRLLESHRGGAVGPRPRPPVHHRAVGGGGQGGLRRRRTPGYTGALRQRRRQPRDRERSSPPTRPGSRRGPRPGRSSTTTSGAGGSLDTTTPTSTGPDASFRPNPAVRPADDLASTANAWAAQPPYNWTTVPAANGIAFQTPPFTTDTTIVGRQPQPDAQIDGAGHRPPGHGDRGPAGARRRRSTSPRASCAAPTAR
jgi:hypothetical protein